MDASNRLQRMEGGSLFFHGHLFGRLTLVMVFTIET